MMGWGLRGRAVHSGATANRASITLWCAILVLSRVRPQGAASCVAGRTIQAIAALALAARLSEVIAWAHCSDREHPVFGFRQPSAMRTTRRTNTTAARALARIVPFRSLKRWIKKPEGSWVCAFVQCLYVTPSDRYFHCYFASDLLGRCFLIWRWRGKRSDQPRPLT